MPQRCLPRLSPKLPLCKAQLFLLITRALELAWTAPRQALATTTMSSSARSECCLHLSSSSLASASTWTKSCLPRSGSASTLASVSVVITGGRALPTSRLLSKQGSLMRWNLLLMRMSSSVLRCLLKITSRHLPFASSWSKMAAFYALNSWQRLMTVGSKLCAE